MTSPTISIPTTDVTSSGDQYVDALLGPAKWAGAVGPGATLSYSFPWANGGTAVFAGSNGSPYSSLSEYTSGHALDTQVQQPAAASALGAWAAVANLTFLPVTETATEVGDIRFAFTSVTDTSATGGVAWGWATLPDANAPAAGDIWITTYSGLADSGWGPASENYESLLHELGHALGLKHPFEDPVKLPVTMDTEQYSVMSYTPAQHSVFFKITNNPDGGKTGNLYAIHPDTPMLLDIAAMQYLYGANMSYHTGNDVYTFEPSTPFMRTIWDAGGNDTISVANFTLGTIVDLRPGHFSKITILSDSTQGFTFDPSAPTPNYDGTDNLAIAYGVTIENAVGGAGADAIFGNAAANDLLGGGGNDTIDGGAANDTIDGGDGVDTVSYTGPRSNFLLARTTSGFTVTDNTPAEGADTLASIERLHFADPAAHTDSFLALDLDGNAGEVAKILGAVFGAAWVQRADYVGIGLSYADGGMSYADLMQLALNAAGLTSNKAVVDTLYFNVTTSQPAPDVESQYIGFLQDHTYTTATLAVMAADTDVNQSHIGLVGLAATGLGYIPA
jgi:serralysin